ncbi:MAG: hypothetical protein Q8N54_00350 [Sulfurimicrobium sp.]|nr:hypothetical protein [Sulfurimicrobium sp.]MDP1703410.1 hypothetical protein [Sulfurimicrobium sp.]MDP2198416.1 hypothetical protein [Sulfurimicrobium sp.]MDP2961179.1 hypothetical protein [Sulfurimicrobium sp.]MDP3689221.1 hypothetical protein [Sulfurimicrobium sp.]
MAAENSGGMGSWVALLSAVSPLLKSGGGGIAPQPAGPIQAESSISIDSSGYVVNQGSGKASNSSATGFQLTQWEIAGLVLLGLLALLKLSKKK